LGFFQETPQTWRPCQSWEGTIPRLHHTCGFVSCLMQILHTRDSTQPGEYMIGQKMVTQYVLRVRRICRSTKRALQLKWQSVNAIQDGLEVWKAHVNLALLASTNHLAFIAPCVPVTQCRLVEPARANACLDTKARSLSGHAPLAFPANSRPQKISRVQFARLARFRNRPRPPCANCARSA
jgi:hypothetical protein